MLGALVTGTFAGAASLVLPRGLSAAGAQSLLPQPWPGQPLPGNSLDAPGTAAPLSSNAFTTPNSSTQQHDRLMDELLPRAREALGRHGAAIARRDMMGIVDFAAPSRAARFNIIDVESGRVISTHLVAHGKGSDPANSGWAERFSNRPGSNASCQGAFTTGETYYGEHGLSRRLNGLDPENSLARPRNIVIHAAAYVDHGMAADLGRIGRSQGCFAVSPRDIGLVLDRLGPGRLLLAAK